MRVVLARYVDVLPVRGYGARDAERYGRRRDRVKARAVVYPALQVVRDDVDCGQMLRIPAQIRLENLVSGAPGHAPAIGRPAENRVIASHVAQRVVVHDDSLPARLLDQRARPIPRERSNDGAAGAAPEIQRLDELRAAVKRRVDVGISA